MDSEAIKSYQEKQVVTTVWPVTPFYPAHLAHQEYLLKKPDGYCTHRKRFDWDKLTQKLEKKSEKVKKDNWKILRRLVDTTVKI